MGAAQRCAMGDSAIDDRIRWQIEPVTCKGIATMRFASATCALIALLLPAAPALAAEAAKRLIAEIQASSPDDEYFGSKVKVLSEMIKHHVKEEEQPEGMFAEARDSEMDLKALGEQMAERKAELEGGSADSDDSDEGDDESPKGKKSDKGRASVRASKR